MIFIKKKYLYSLAKIDTQPKFQFSISAIVSINYDEEKYIDEVYIDEEKVYIVMYIYIYIYIYIYSFYKIPIF